MLKRIFKEPLVHFLLAGFLLFVYFETCSVPKNIENTIIVSKESVLNYMQYQSKAFNREVFEEKFNKFSQREKDLIIQKYIEDEVVYREAIMMGLDQNDFIIKRRIIQKLEFMLDDFDERSLEISEDSLKAYYSQHPEKYYQSAQYTFAHVFFNESKKDVLTNVNSFLENNSSALSESKSLQYGDRFLYNRIYANKSAKFIEGQFGSAFTDSLDMMDVNINLWQGPILSSHGYHFVNLTSKENEGVIGFSEIKNIVRKDYLAFLKNKNKKANINKLKDAYNVELNVD